MILLFDVGNTRTKGAWVGGESFPHFFHFPTQNLKEKLQSIFSDTIPEHVGLVTVVPKALAIFSEVCSIFGVKFTAFDGLSPCPLELRYEKPEKLGADRIAGALGAYAHVPNQSPLIVVDAGTAVNIEVVAENAYLGGAIMPGLQLYKKSLKRGTAQLPEFPLALPKTPIGTNTQTALQSGVVYGYIGGIQAVIEAMQVALKATPTVMITGGDAAFISPILASQTRLQLEKPMPHLVLEGLLFWMKFAGLVK